MLSIMKLILTISIFNIALFSSVLCQETAIVELGNGSRIPVNRTAGVSTPTTTVLPGIDSDPSRPRIQFQSNATSPLLPGVSVGSSAALTLPGIGEVNLPDLNAFTLPPLFGPTPCLGTNLMAGTCKREAECTKGGGQTAGPCALNLGVCCTKTSQCGETVRLNESIFTNPNYPEPSPLSELCSLSIVKLPGVGQLRLDIIDLQIGEVDEGGKCSKDALVIEGLNPGFAAPRLCGFMSNQHMYLPVDETAIGGTVNLRLILSPEPTPRLFKIKVTQVPLGSAQSAPPGCLQYFSSPSGVVSSFNFESTKNVGIRNIGGLTYAICFRQEAGMCSVRFDPTFLGSSHSVAKRSVDPLAPVQMADPLGAKSFPRSAKIVSLSPSSAYPPKAYQGYQIRPTSPKTFNYRQPAPAQKQYVHRPAPQRPVYRFRPSYKQYKPTDKKTLKPRPFLSRQSYSNKQLHQQPYAGEPKKQQQFQQYQASAYRQPAPPQSYSVSHHAPTRPHVYQSPRPAYQTPAPKQQYYRPHVHQRPVYQPAAAPQPKPAVSYPVYAPVEVKNEITPIVDKKIPDLVEAKVDLVQSLINEKTQILNSLLNSTGTGLPSIIPAATVLPTAATGLAGVGLPAVLPIVPIPQVPTLTDSALRPFLPSLPTAGLGSFGGSLLPGAPIDLAALASCDGKDSIGFPPGAILCDDNVGPVVLSTAPFMVFVDNRGSSPSKGFSFSYRQQICS